MATIEVYHSFEELKATHTTTREPDEEEALRRVEVAKQLSSIKPQK